MTNHTIELSDKPLVHIIIKGTGSSGNSTVIKDVKTGKSIVVDAGIKPTKRMDNILGVLITHCHRDHTNFLYSFKDINIYGTEEELTDGRVMKMYDMIHRVPKFNFIEADKAYNIGTFNIIPISAEHDTSNPVHYVISVNGRHIFYGCDSVSYPDYYDLLFEQCDLLLIDCNYDETLMGESNYSDDLKKRIVERGHASSRYVKERLGKYEDKLVLYHLSQYNNMASKMDEDFPVAVAVVSRDRCPVTIKL